MDDYNQGKDIYMQLATAYRPDLPYDELKKRFRGKCKRLHLIKSENPMNCWEATQSAV